MNMKCLSKTQKLVFSAMVMAIYVVVLYCTQSFSFGAYQIRVATSLYALSYLCPFLVFPLGLANLLGNLICGGLGLLDFLGGFLVGVLTSYAHVLIRKRNLPIWLIILTITFIPGLIVPIWLSYLIHLPYIALATNLCIGQLVCGVVGVILIKALKPIFYLKTKEA